MGHKKRSWFSPISIQILSFLLIIISENSTAIYTLTHTQGISVGETLISSGKTFELGFFNPGNSGKQYMGIWYKNVSGQKPVWVANRVNPLKVTDSNSSFTVGSDGNLRLLDGMKNTVWSTNLPSQSNGTIAVLSDIGNLVLKDSLGLILWQSFNDPGDTFIPGMKIGKDKNTGESYLLSSWKSGNDPSVGDFVMEVTTEEQPQVYIRKSSTPFWRSGPWDGQKFIGVLYTTGVWYSDVCIVMQERQSSVYLTYTRNGTLLLKPDGNLKISRSTNNRPVGSETWEATKGPCDYYGACGPFGICHGYKSKPCDCLEGFVPKAEEDWNRGNWSGGCVRRTELQCGATQIVLTPGDGNSDGFRKLSKVKVPDHHGYVSDTSASGCRQWCLSRCFCVAYAYQKKRIGCMVWTGDLLDTEQFSSSGVDLFLRLAPSELDKGSKKTELVVLLTTLPGGLIFLAVIIYCLYRCKANLRVSMRKRERESSELPFYEFTTIAAATNGFNETNKLGAGGFGPVYKGTLENGQEIAIKRLSSLSGQGVVEFKNEISLISNLQHRNLVRLIGYCIKGDEKLLIYEYLKNKSLDNFLFGKKKSETLDWTKRFNIIEGIARGLLYLHRDSCLRIIHRDLKAGNILLDDDMNPKISDFGLARVFEITQEQATHRVVGTFGYMSPEYAVGGLFSEKSDVFSFGVLLLEIISGVKNTSFQYQDDHINLIGYAWHLWNEGTGIELMDKELSNSCNETEFMKCMQIGLLCVQDHTVERPTMPAVVLMLTGEKDIPLPRRTTFYESMMSASVHSQPNNGISNNDVTISVIEGR